MEGYLRKSVKVFREADSVCINHALWTVTLPGEWVDGQPGLWPVLEGRMPKQSLPEESEELRDVLRLLELQQCFYAVEDKESYSFKELLRLFEPVCSEWYAEYYSHPLWRRLRDGALSPNGFIAWVIHNYHVSRAAGMTDARCATRAPRAVVRRAFRAGALEEYWHCDAFYFVRTNEFSVPADEVKSYVQLPSTLAFEQQMLRMAEEDWLGYALFSYFQESSIRFYEDCKEFYRDVEQNYGLEGFFTPWKQHIELDFGHKHAEGFAALFDSDECLTRDEVTRSVRNASFAFKFLLGSLDELLEQDIDGSRILLRRPIREGWLDPEETSLLARYKGMEKARLSATNVLELYEQFASTVPGGRIALGGAVPSLLQEWDAEFLLKKITEAAFENLGNARGHDELIFAGELAEQATGISRDVPGGEQEDSRPRSPWVSALANFFHEAARQAVEFGFACYLAYNLNRSSPRGRELEGLPKWLPVGDSGAKVLESFLRRSAICACSADKLINFGLQFNELFSRWLLSRGEIYEVDLFPSKDPSPSV